jgi:hypothetical protein
MFGRWPFCKMERARSLFPAGLDSISLVNRDIPFVIFDSTFVVVLAGQGHPYSIGYNLCFIASGLELKITQFEHDFDT